MGLLDLWTSDRAQINDKKLSQLIVFAGDGKLLDGGDTSLELRELLSVVPSERIGEWITECLDERFTDFGLVLQDVVNEIGRRLNFCVTPGVYRGRSDRGYDGVWTIGDTQAMVVETKTSTDYRIDLTRIALYRTQISDFVSLPLEDVSILIVVGSENTEELEAQVRGSRYAWNVRLLGLSALFRLLQLKESLDDPAVERQIQEILIPHEFTRLDPIVDLVFSTVEDAQEQDPVIGTTEVADSTDAQESRDAPASFHSEIIPKLERHFAQSLVKKSRVIWTAKDGTLVSCQVSKRHEEKPIQFWFGLKRTTKEKLEVDPRAFCAVGLGNPDCVVVMPFRQLQVHLDEMFKSPDGKGDISHWHVRFSINGSSVFMMTNHDQERLDVSDLVIT